MRQMWRVSTASVLVLTLLVVASCATVPQNRLELHPTRGQLPEQLDRDEWECRLWAQQETGFQPGASLRNGALAGIFVLMGLGSAIGAVVGATQTAAGTGAAIGAAAGLTVGPPVGSQVEFARGADSFERAFRACSGARGYELR